MIKKTLSFLYLLYHKIIICNLVASSNNKVREQDVPYYFMAADICLIHRLQILNSGNLPLGFHYGKVVVGPDVGNVGSILKQTDNITFNVSEQESAADAIRKAFHLVQTGKGQQNKMYAEENWSQRIIATQLAECYEQLMQ